MTDTFEPSLRAELTAAATTLAQQVRGLDHFLKIASSPAAATVIAHELMVRQRRLDCINAVIGALDNVDSKMAALLADGYPTFKPAEGVQAVFIEIQAEEQELEMAAKLFRAGAAMISLDIPGAIHRAQPIPSK